MKKILFIIILFGTIVFTGYIMRPKDTDVCVQQISDFHSIEKNTLDAIVYGSSHSWLGFDSKEFESITGYRTYNYSCFWQSFNTTWLFINDSFITQTPKVVFVDVGRVNDYLHDMELEGQIYYTRKLKNSKEKIMFLIQCFGNNLEGYISYCFPIVSFHNKWENISELFEEKQHNDFISSSGQMISNGHTSFKNELIGYNMRSDDEMTEYILSINEYEGGEIGEQDICPENIVLMNDITDKCKEKNIRLIWYVTPYVGDYNYDRAMKDYVSKNGGEYINLFEHINDIGLDANSDFSDSDHLNASGAKKVAVYLSEYINTEK